MLGKTAQSILYLGCSRNHVILYPAAWRPTPPPRCSQVGLRIRLWTQPGCSEDSFSLNLGFPGGAGSVPTVLHDATDTGTDYILKHLILVGPKGGKMMPGEPKKFGLAQGCQNDTHGIQNSTKMNPARLVWGFIFIEFCNPWPSVWWRTREPKWNPGHPKRYQNDAQGVQNSMKMKPGAPKGGPMSKRTKKEHFSDLSPLPFGHPF